MKQEVETKLKILFEKYCDIIIAEESKQKNIFLLNRNLAARDLVYLFYKIEETFSIRFKQEHIRSEHLMYFDRIVDDVCMLMDTKK